MRELEEASKILMAPPNEVTPDQRKKAEDMFLEFRNLRNPYGMCRNILESCENEYVLFETGQLIRRSVIREWNDLQKENLVELRQYLIQYLVHRPNLFHSSRESLVQAVAVIVKRYKIQFSEKTSSFMSEMESLLNLQDPSVCFVVCCIMLGVTQEYSSGVNTVNFGISLNQHIKGKTQFETVDMLKMFELVSSLLAHVAQNDVDGNMRNLVAKLIQIEERIFTWPFLHLPAGIMIRAWAVYEPDISITFRPPKEWSEMVKGGELIRLFFMLYEKYRDDFQLSHHLMLCLIQIVSLNGECFETTDDNTLHIKNFCIHFSQYLTKYGVKESEALGISTIFRKLFLCSVHVLNRRGAFNIVDLIMPHITTYTIEFIKAAAKERSADPEDQLYPEAIEKMLLCWSSLLKIYDSEEKAKEELKPNFHQVFMTFVEHHMGPPHGPRKPEVLNEIEEDTQQPDYILYHDQISCVGEIASVNLEKTFMLLAALFEERVESLKNMYLQAISASDRGMNTDFSSIYEDLNWLLMISGFIIANPVCAHRVSNYTGEFLDGKSHEEKKKETLLFTNVDKSIHEIPGGEQCNYFFRMLASIFRLWKLEMNMLDANMDHVLSPVISSTIVWLVKKFIPHTIQIYNSVDHKTPEIISSIGGRRMLYSDVEGVKWMGNFCISAIGQLLRKRSSETLLVEQCSDLLCRLVDKKTNALYISKLNSFMELVYLSQSDEINKMSTHAQRGLLTGIIMCGVGFPMGDDANRFWALILDPIMINFRILVNDDFSKNYHHETVRNKFLRQLDNFIGIANGCQAPTVQYININCMREVLDTSCKLLDVYHNYQDIVDAIIELYLACSKRLLCFINEKDAEVFYRSTVEMMSVYAKHNIGRRALKGDDDQCTDMQMLMELLSNILQKDYLDLSTLSENVEETKTVSPVEVCLYGIGIIMPLMSVGFLKIPGLCLHYYKLILFVAESQIVKVCELSEELMKRLMNSVEIGLSSFGSEIAGISLDFLGQLAGHVCMHCSSGERIHKYLKPFLSILFNMILHHEVNADIIRSASMPVHALVRCYQDDFQEYMASVIQSQSDSVVRVKLNETYEKLCVSMAGAFKGRGASGFAKAFEEFINVVRAYVWVK